MNHPEAAQDTVRMIESLGRRALAVKADVAKRAEAQDAVAEIEKRLGPIDILVSNAGVQKRIFFLDLQEEDWDWIVDTNLKGCYLEGQAVAARMKERGRGKIINIPSEAAGFPAQRMAAYCVSKAGVTMLTKVHGAGTGPVRHPRQRLGAGAHAHRYQQNKDLDDEAFPEDSPLLKAAQETGFQPYSTEHVYLRESADGSETKSEAPAAFSFRRKKADDEYRLFELYHASVPPRIRRAEGMTYKEWQSNRDRSLGQEWVFDKGGDLVAWVATDVGRHCGHLNILAAAKDEMRSAVEYGLSSLGNCRQVCCLVPDFDGALLQLLGDRGFSRVMTHTVMTKELMVRVVEPYVMPAVPA